MAFIAPDFVVPYDPDHDPIEKLTNRIIRGAINQKLKRQKPRNVFISGDSGEGKSYTALALQIAILEENNIDLNTVLDDVNIYTPLEYAQKIDNLIYNKELKKVPVACIHEAREIVKAKNWQTFLAQAVNDINAMSRSLKRMCTIIVSQFIRDITSDTRYSLHYYLKVSRPSDGKARIKWYVLYKDDRDLEKPKLRKRRLFGYLVYPDGRYRKFIPQQFIVRMPPRDICRRFNEHDAKAKGHIIRGKIDELTKRMQKEAGLKSKKLESMLTYYMDNMKMLDSIGRMYRGKWKLKPNIRHMHELTPSEVTDFQNMLNEELKKRKVIPEDDTP